MYFILAIIIIDVLYIIYSYIKTINKQNKAEQYVKDSYEYFKDELEKFKERFF